MASLNNNSRNSPARIVVAASCAALLLNGCASRQANRFEAFAKAGGVYADAMESLTEQAGAVAIDTDSDILLAIREPLIRQERQQHYQAHTEAIKSLLAQLKEIDRHASLLKSYFVLLARLAGSDQPRQVAQDARQLVDSLVGVGAVIDKGWSGKSIGGTYLDTGTSFIVGELRQKALEEELRLHGPVIVRELELQLSALKALSIQMRSDTSVTAGIREHTMLMKPYASGAPVPPEWKRTRQDALNGKSPSTALDAATRSATMLRESFIALAEGRLAPKEIDALLAAIDAATDTVSKRTRPYR
jgi:hypothetical protein